MPSNAPIERPKPSFPLITWGLAAFELSFYGLFLYVFGSEGLLDTEIGRIAAVVIAVLFTVQYFVVRHVLIRNKLAKSADHAD